MYLRSLRCVSVHGATKYFIALLIMVTASCSDSLTHRHNIGYQSIVDGYVNTLTNNTASNLNATRVTSGPLRVSFMPTNGNAVPMWQNIGNIVKCGEGVCFGGESLIEIRNRYGVNIGIGTRPNRPTFLWLVDGHLLVSGGERPKVIGGWYQGDDQLAAATERYAQTAQSVFSRHAQLQNTDPTVSYSDVVTTLGAISSVAAAYNSGQVTQQQRIHQNQQQAVIEQTRQRENAARQQERDQDAFDRRREEQRIELERNMQREQARVAEERRQLDAYRQRLPGGSNRGGDLPNCRTRELGCTGNGYCPPLCPGE